MRADLEALSGREVHRADREGLRAPPPRSPARSARFEDAVGPTRLSLVTCQRAPADRETTLVLRGIAKARIVLQPTLMNGKIVRRSSTKNSSSAPVAWAAVLALVTAACGGAVDEPGGSSNGGSSSGGSSSGGSSSGGSSSGGTANGGSTSPGGGTSSSSSYCNEHPCGQYVEQPDGTTEPAPTDGGVPEGATIKYCFCGNG